MNSERMICSWAMGVTQHKNGVANVQTITPALCPHARTHWAAREPACAPVRGHSNVQGDRTSWAFRNA